MFAIYLITVLLLARVKKIQNELEERVRLRTAALSHEIQERVRLQREVLETSDREQKRIARELHDGLCQHLTGTALAGHLLEQKLDGKAQAEAEAAGRLVQLIEEAIELTRDLSHQLDPVEVSTGRLADHFADLAAESSERFQVACRFEGNLTRPVADLAIATHLYRIALEAVMNAIKIRRAGRINIGLDSAADEIVLTITDDGAGWPEKNALDTQPGLRAMAYRADLMGAAFNFERLTPQGNRVTCVLPAPSAGTQNADPR
jgi:signal transduction histidine kinase